MAKAESFQDLSLMPLQDGRELWEWLYTELRAAILDGRLKSARVCLRLVVSPGSTICRAARGIHA
jgi:hypothetical protein